jgi:hypothetical protein
VSQRGGTVTVSPIPILQSDSIWARYDKIETGTTLVKTRVVLSSLES